MYMMKCVCSATVSSIILLVGLSACDEGKIQGGYAFEDPTGGITPDLTLPDAVQRQIFNARCVQCHGGSTHAAAGLYLTAGLSREALINRPSTVVDGATLLIPGNHQGSLLYRAVATNVSTGWAYNHSALLSDSEKYLLSTWIDLEN